MHAASRCSLRLLLGGMVLSSFLACDRDEPESAASAPPDLAENTYAPWDRSLYLAPVRGFTTAWHHVPDSLTVPLGTELTFRQPTVEDATVFFYGANPMGRSPRFATASFHATELGVATISSVCRMPDGSQEIDQVIVRVVDPVRPEDVLLTPITLEAEPFDLDESATNEETMAWYFGGSIATVDDRPDGSYFTSTWRRFRAETTPVNAPLTSIIEWRIDGEAICIGSLLHSPTGPNLDAETGTTVRPDFRLRHPGTFVITAGPPGNETDPVTLELYGTHIISHESNVDVLEDRITATFEAVTDPPGHEDRITWLSSTKIGSGSPVVGQGPTFTVTFDDTWYPDDGGFLQQWLGVRADGDIFNQDQKCEFDATYQLMVDAITDFAIAQGLDTPDISEAQLVPGDARDSVMVAWTENTWVLDDGGDLVRIDGPEEQKQQYRDQVLDPYIDVCTLVARVIWAPGVETIALLHGGTARIIQEPVLSWYREPTTVGRGDVSESFGPVEFNDFLGEEIAIFSCEVESECLPFECDYNNYVASDGSAGGYGTGIWRELASDVGCCAVRYALVGITGRPAVAYDEDTGEVSVSGYGLAYYTESNIVLEVCCPGCVEEECDVLAVSLDEHLSTFAANRGLPAPTVVDAACIEFIDPDDLAAEWTDNTWVYDGTDFVRIQGDGEQELAYQEDVILPRIEPCGLSAWVDWGDDVVTRAIVTPGGEILEPVTSWYRERVSPRGDDPAELVVEFTDGFGTVAATFVGNAQAPSCGFFACRDVDATSSDDGGELGFVTDWYVERTEADLPCCRTPVAFVGAVGAPEIEYDESGMSFTVTGYGYAYYDATEIVEVCCPPCDDCDGDPALLTAALDTFADNVGIARPTLLDTLCIEAGQVPVVAEEWVDNAWVYTGSGFERLVGPGSQSDQYAQTVVIPNLELCGTYAHVEWATGVVTVAAISSDGELVVEPVTNWYRRLVEVPRGGTPDEIPPFQLEDGYGNPVTTFSASMGAIECDPFSCDSEIDCQATDDGIGIITRCRFSDPFVTTECCARYVGFLAAAGNPKIQFNLSTGEYTIDGWGYAYYSATETLESCCAPCDQLDELTATLEGAIAAGAASMGVSPPSITDARDIVFSDDYSAIARSWTESTWLYTGAGFERVDGPDGDQIAFAQAEILPFVRRCGIVATVDWGGGVTTEAIVSPDGDVIEPVLAWSRIPVSPRAAGPVDAFGPFEYRDAFGAIAARFEGSIGSITCDPFVCDANVSCTAIDDGLGAIARCDEGEVGSEEFCCRFPVATLGVVGNPTIEFDPDTGSYDVTGYGYVYHQETAVLEDCCDPSEVGTVAINLLPTTPTYSGCADYAWIDDVDCTELATDPVDGEAFLWLVISDADRFSTGVGGVQFGVEYDPTIDVFGWTLCTGGSEIPGDGWPATGTGNAMTWESGCYEPDGDNARIGFLAVVDGDPVGDFRVIPDPRYPSGVAWADCQARAFSICAEHLADHDLSQPIEPICTFQCVGAGRVIPRLHTLLDPVWW